jgi:hypothetical protein
MKNEKKVEKKKSGNQCKAIRIPVKWTGLRTMATVSNQGMDAFICDSEIFAFWIWTKSNLGWIVVSSALLAPFASPIAPACLVQAICVSLYLAGKTGVNSRPMYTSHSRLDVYHQKECGGG